MGFRYRLALLLIVTVTAVQVATALVAYIYLRHSLLDQAKGELSAAAGVLKRQLGIISERVADDVEVLSLDFALRQAIAQRDYDTELSVLRNHGRRVGATRMVLVNLNGKSIADTGAPGVSEIPFEYGDLLDSSIASGQGTAIATLGGKIYWIVVAPVRAPVPIAFIAACIPIDDELLKKLSALSDFPLSIALATPDRSGRWTVQSRTARGPATFPLPNSRQPSATEATVGDFFTVTTVLRTAEHSAPIVAILGFPLAEALSAYRSIVPPLLAFLGCALLLAAGLAMLVVRNMSKPLEALAGSARRIASGDYASPEPVGTKDEIGQLADALIAMTHSIADREAALTSTIGALEIAHGEAVKANKAKSQFLANMSHELRTPLNAIVGFGEMLHQEFLGPLGAPRYREYAADILASGQRLLDLVSRMLDLAEIESGTLVLDRNLTSASEALRQAVAAIRPQAEARKVSIAICCDSSIAASIEGDANKLRQSFTSILHNAIKFSPEGGEVVASLALEVGAVVIRITDLGAGMNEADIEIVTRPFHRLRSALDGQHQGAGLGLPFAKAIVELHGGTLSISSAPGAGTVVEVRLPAKARMSAAA
ncbi:MAG TPA: ATP-binding protein [Rhizomicrobium sp.]|jgi:signal transduction histidine kinase|nr:ATP-binding protein [Rhizomicrobium sp.]